MMLMSSDSGNSSELQNITLDSTISEEVTEIINDSQDDKENNESKTRRILGDYEFQQGFIDIIRFSKFWSKEILNYISVI